MSAAYWGSVLTGCDDDDDDDVFFTFRLIQINNHPILRHSVGEIHELKISKSNPIIWTFFWKRQRCGIVFTLWVLLLIFQLLLPRHKQFVILVLKLKPVKSYLLLLEMSSSCSDNRVRRWNPVWHVGLVASIRLWTRKMILNEVSDVGRPLPLCCFECFCRSLVDFPLSPVLCPL